MEKNRSSLLQLSEWGDGLATDSQPKSDPTQGARGCHCVMGSYISCHVKPLDGQPAEQRETRSSQSFSTRHRNQQVFQEEACRGPVF